MTKRPSTRSVRIKGLIKVAESVRRELAGGLSHGRKARLRATIADALKAVDRIVEEHGVSIDHLPAPSQRAYRFLPTLDLEVIASRSTGESALPARGRVTLVGLKSYLDGIVAQLAEVRPGGSLTELHDSIRSTSAKIEKHLQTHGLDSTDLTEQSRAIRGWLAYFAEREHLGAYCMAVKGARLAFEAAIRRDERFSLPAVIEFRPTRGLYRLRAYRTATRVVLAIPMICFTDEMFAVLADAAIGGGPKQALVEAAHGEAYQGIQAEFEALIGVHEQTAGVHRDLAASFQRVVATYFHGALSPPRLAWSKAFTGRKFGHYDPVRDTVMISSTLDRADVPEFVLDAVMHHELLHKKLGVGWHCGRMSVHPPQFREEEQRFARFHEADSILRRLAAEV